MRSELCSVWGVDDWGAHRNETLLTLLNPWAMADTAKIVHRREFVVACLSVVWLTPCHKGLNGPLRSSSSEAARWIIHFFYHQSQTLLNRGHSIFYCIVATQKSSALSEPKVILFSTSIPLCLVRTRHRQNVNTPHLIFHTLFDDLVNSSDWLLTAQPWSRTSSPYSGFTKWERS